MKKYKKDGAAPKEIFRRAFPRPGTAQGCRTGQTRPVMLGEANATPADSDC